MKKTLTSFAALLAVYVTLSGQDGFKLKQKPAHPKVDQAKVDAAIEKGCAWLLTKNPDNVGYQELVVLTLAHSGLYPESCKEMSALVKSMTERDLSKTYNVALQAMALQKINPQKYQARIAQCAQFLIDNQCENGQWDYGEKIVADPVKAPEEKTIETPSENKDAEKKPKPAKIKVTGTKTRKMRPNGDNSNTQYAILGLRACIDAGIEIDRSVLIRTRDWFLKTQNKNGGWGYNQKGVINENGDPMSPWPGNHSYGSMTTGAAGSLCICLHYLRQDYRSYGPVLKAMDWISKEFDITKNPHRYFAHYYYLYALERAGILYGTERFGTHEWYSEGAKYLLDNQQATGQWKSAAADIVSGDGIYDTCFAILFLRRGTTPLVNIETHGGSGKQK